MPSPGEKIKTERKRFYRKRVRLFNLIDKIKLWPSRKGHLHGIRVIEVQGNTAKLITHCNKEFFVNNSINSRAARWLRNKLFVEVCPKCCVPDWKLKKYSATLFKKHQGALLQKKTENKRYVGRFVEPCPPPISLEKENQYVNRCHRG